MPDISIPGVNSKYGTQQVIQGLVNVEKNKLTKMEGEKKVYQSDKEIWQNLNRHMQSVRDTARTLYGFNNPFSSKLGTSSDEKALTVAATRTAGNGDYKVKILNTAGRDQFLSQSLAQDTEVPAGQYDFQVGEKKVSVNFKGGRLQAFADAINGKNPDLLKASLVKDSATSQILDVEAIPVGAKNHLKFSGASQELMTKLGVIGPPQSQDKILLDSPLTLGPLASKALPAPGGALPKTAILEIRYSLEKQDPAKTTPPPAAGFTLPDAGSLTFKDVQLNYGQVLGDIPQPPPPAPPPEVRDMKVAQVSGEGKTISLPEFAESETEQTLTFPLGESLSKLDEVRFENKNTGRTVKITSVKVSDPTQRGDYQPLHPLDQAKDSVIEFDGIRIVRDSNSLTDIIPGVTLNLLDSTKEPVKVKVEPDKKTIKDAIGNYLANYNRLISDILVLTTYPQEDPRNSPIIQEAVYFTDDEKKNAEKNLGRYQGDLALNQLKSSLQRTMMNPYPSEGAKWKVLSDIGISTNRTGSSDSQDPSKRRGYLELDEAKLDSALTADVDSVKKLFGTDTTGNLVVNYGAAYSVDELLRPFTQLGGFNANRMATLDSQMKTKDKEIADYKVYLQRYEADLKRKYGNMESTLNQMEKNFSQMDNLGR